MRNPTARPVPAKLQSAASDQPSGTNLKRRRFLFSLSAGGAGAAAAAVAAAPAIAAVLPESAPAPGDAGYRETEHVRDYYRTARL